MKLPRWVEAIRIRLDPPVHHEEIARKSAMIDYQLAAIEEKATAEKARDAIEQLLQQMGNVDDAGAV